MATVLRLSRGGAKKRPFYHLVATDSRSPRDSKLIEKLGIFDPMLAKDNAARVKIDADRIKYWLSVGAKPSDRVNRLLSEAGITKPNDVTGKPQKTRKKAEKLTRAEKRAVAAAAPKEAPAAVAEAAPAAEAPAAEAAAPASETAA